jgi:hypothetical protein
LRPAQSKNPEELHSPLKVRAFQPQQHPFSPTQNHVKPPSPQLQPFKRDSPCIRSAPNRYNRERRINRTHNATGTKIEIHP